MSLPLVSIIIVTHNALPLLQRFLPGVANTNYPNLELIIADNASTDGTGAWVKSAFPEAVHIRHPNNWLFCKGNNQAAKHARGKYVLLLNNDVQVEADWLTPLVEALERHEKAAAVQPKMLQMDGKTFEYAGAAGGFVDSIGYPFAQGRLFDTTEVDHGQYDHLTDIFWASGAAILLNRQVFEEIGMLDEHFQMHMEEVDLCWRLHRAGYRILFEPKSRVRHLGGSSLSKDNPRKTYYNFRNSLLMLFKNTPAQAWPALFARRIAFDVAAAGRFLARGELRHARAIFRAYSDAHDMKKLYDSERPTPEDAYPLPYVGHIAIDYYLRNRATKLDLPSEHFRPPFRPHALTFAAKL